MLLTNKPVTANQKMCIGVLVTKLLITKEDKKVMVQGFTGGRAESTTDMFYDEAIAMIRHLKSLDPDETKCKPMRGKILYYAHLIGWTKMNSKNVLVVDVERVDKWMLQYSYLHKKLFYYNYSELPKLVTQFEHMHNDVIRRM